MATSTKNYPIEDWRRLHRDGWTWVKIAKHYNVERTAVIRWCRGTYAAQKAERLRIKRLAAKREKKQTCEVCGILLAASVDNQYPHPVKGHVCNWCRDHYPERAKEVDDGD